MGRRRSQRGGRIEGGAWKNSPTSPLPHPPTNLRSRGVAEAALVADLVGGALAVIFFRQGGAENPIAPETFQSFNPLFIVTLTFAVMATRPSPKALSAPGGSLQWAAGSGSERATKARPNTCVSY